MTEGRTNIEDKEVEMLNAGKNSWFTKYSCNSKLELILCSIFLVYVKILLMTEIWITSWLENNEVVSFLFLLWQERYVKIIGTMIFKLNAILTSKSILARLRTTS